MYARFASKSVDAFVRDAFLFPVAPAEGASSDRRVVLTLSRRFAAGRRPGKPI